MTEFSYSISRRRKHLKNSYDTLSSKRLKYLKFSVVLVTIIIIIRIGQLQLFSYGFYNNLASKQYNNIRVIPANRGKIFLKNYESDTLIPIAINRTLDMVYADPKVLENKSEVAKNLAPILKMPEKEILDKINTKFKDYVRLVIDPDAKTILQIKNLDLPGVYIKTAFDYKLDEFKYIDDEEIKVSAINSISDEEKEKLKSQVIEIAANPVEIIDLDSTATKLSKILDGYTKEDLLRILKKKELRYVPLKKRLSMEQSDKIEALGYYGIVLWPENWRFYPEKTLAAHILGFVDKQGVGQYGLEGQYDSLLRGQDGERMIDLDIKGNPIAVGDNQIIKPVIDGANFILTIDRSLQSYAEKSLEDTVKLHHADSGSVVVMNPKTGKIIVMANYPTFNPNEYFKAYERDEKTGEYINEIGPKVFYNPAIASAYEFGSTFKVITIATALDSGEMNETDTVCDYTGEVSIDKYKIRNADLKAHKCMTLAGVLEKSSNIGALRVGLKIGSGVFRKYITDFGFGEYTDIGFNVENNGYLGPVKEWGKVKTANASFGQGLTGSPLQLVRAVSVIANQGKLLKPFLIQEIDNNGNIEKTSTHEVRRVISPSTAAKTTQMMVSAVDNGVASPAKLNGWTLAAKTGTAQVAVKGGYSNKKYIASVVGFAPASDPKYVMLVKIDYPKTSKFGSIVAAPLFKQLSEYILKYYEIPKDR